VSSIAWTVAEHAIRFAPLVACACERMRVRVRARACTHYRSKIQMENKVPKEYELIPIRVLINPDRSTNNPDRSTNNPDTGTDDRDNGDDGRTDHRVAPTARRRAPTSRSWPRPRWAAPSAARCTTAHVVLPRTLCYRARCTTAHVVLSRTLYYRARWTPCGASRILRCRSHAGLYVCCLLYAPWCMLQSYVARGVLLYAACCRSHAEQLVRVLPVACCVTVVCCNVVHTYQPYIQAGMQPTIGSAHHATYNISCTCCWICAAA
jgi:hypothetical protein